ncbi:MAG: hypothetical protein Ta2A_05220 [Treponemataceae bacterium]|nr:MAG: hypothetical protein Ta2A_05220 [Treponemataceae bacterium]
MAEKHVTKSNLIDLIADATGDKKNVVGPIVDQLFETIKATLLEGGSVEVRGFGTFEARYKKGRLNARNLRTGETVDIKPHYAAVFKVGTKLKGDMKALKIKP